jgi:hypothetical protein
MGESGASEVVPEDFERHVDGSECLNERFRTLRTVLSMKRCTGAFVGRSALLAAALGVACLGLPPAIAFGAPTTTTLPASIVVAGNGYARHLLALQPIPSEARKVATLSTPIAPSSDVGDGGLVRHAWNLYLLPLSVSVDSFVRAHLPAGETVTEKGYSDGPHIYPVDNLGLSRSCVSPHITYCGVFYTTTEAKNGEQELRVDVQVIYLPIVHATMPTSGVVTVTGYGKISLMDSSSDPVSVVLTHHQALTLATVVAELKDFGGGMCMEDSQLLKIKIVQDGKVIWSAAADSCPGVLGITSGSSTQTLDARSCAFWHVVNSFFAPGTASGTKVGGESCSDNQDG